MLRRCLATVAIYYPGQLAATLFLITLPSFLWSFRGPGNGRSEVDWITVKQSAELSNLLNASPGSVILAELGLLMLLAGAAHWLSRRSAITAATMLCPGSLVVLALSAFAVRENLVVGTCGVLVGIAGIVQSQRFLLSEVAYWKRAFEAWLPLAAGFQVPPHGADYSDWHPAHRRLQNPGSQTDTGGSR